MGTAPVSGNFNDITGGSFDSREGMLEFTLNSMSLQAGGMVVPDNKRSFKPDADGSFSVTLATTHDMLSDAFYTVRAGWLQQDDNGAQRPAHLRAEMVFCIRVPAGGGRIDKLVDPTITPTGMPTRINPGMVYVSQTAPPKPIPWMLWLQQEPGATPDPFDTKNTGLLKQWRPKP